MIKIQDESPTMLCVNVDFNLRLNPSLFIIIESIEGVEETLHVDAKYEFTVLIGQCFDASSIQEQIRVKIEEFRA